MLKVGLENAAVPLVLAGGVFRHPTTILEDAIVATLRQAAPAIRPMRSPAEPIIGVMLQALSAAGIEIDSSFLDRLLPNVPSVLLAQQALR
jgi:hypothetical protein